MDQEDQDESPPKSELPDCGSIYEYQNLYSILQSTVFNHKKTEGRDVSYLAKFVNAQTRTTFKCIDIGMNMEKSCLSIVLTDVNDLNRLVAHASFTDIPTDPNIDMDGKRWRKNIYLTKATTINTLFMSIFVSRDDEVKETCVQEIIANTFVACDFVEFIILECPNEDYVGGSYIFSPFVSEVLFKVKSGIVKKLIIYSKDILLPKLIIRPGRELDLDDLMPLMTLDAKHLEETFNKAYLIDLISMSERTRSSMVAEFDDSSVGIISVSSHVNYTLLNEQFHLEPFHGLYKPFEEDDIQFHSVSSRLMSDTRNSEIQLNDTFDKKESANAYHGEEVTLVELAKAKERTAAALPDNIHDTEDDDVDTDLVTTYMRRAKSDTSRRALSIRHETSVFTKQTQIPAPSTMDERYVQAPYRLESLENKDFANTTAMEQKALLDKVKVVLENLKEEGQTLDNALLDPQSIRTITEGQGFINYCVYHYLHKTLIDTKFLPIINLNEPQPSVFHGVPNAIALQLVTMDKKYHVRINDLINGAFNAFPTRDYCIVTLPNGTPELPWMRYFVRVTPKAASLHSKTLYVMHRACFSNSIQVRKATAQDYENIVSFLQTLYESEKIFKDFKTAVCAPNCEEFQCFLAKVLTHEDTPIIGVAIIGPEAGAAGYQVSYDLDQYIYFDLHDPITDHGYVHHFIMNPIFQPYAKLVMKEIMRMTRKDCFYHKIYPPDAIDKQVLENQTLLNNMEDWIPLIPRRRIEYSLLNLIHVYDDLRQPPKQAQPSTIPYAAFHYSKKFTFEPKTVISKRVVFIGASDTTLSCLEKLISTPYFDFKDFTLISTHGLPGSLQGDEIRNLFFLKKNVPALSMRTNEEWYQRLPIRSVLNTVYGTAIRILRKIKVVVVDDSKVVPYDILVIATGRQFIRPDSTDAEIIDDRLDTFKRNVKKDDANKSTQKQIPPKPKNVFLINTEVDTAQALNLLRSYIPFVSNRQIIVHGACLEAYCCIRALIELGISSHRITLVSTAHDGMEWETYHTYRDTTQLRELMDLTISQLGIQMLHNYNFLRWKTDESGLCTRVYFKSSHSNFTRRTPENVSVPCLAYFPFCIRRVSDDIASAVGSAFLPYNNGILINTRFETSDPNIMAAGPCTGYDKRLCADKLNHYYFSSYEIGHRLGEFILKRIVPPSKCINISISGPCLPHLTPLLISPLVNYAELPGSWYYLHVSRPGWVNHCCRQAECDCEECDCGTEIVTGSVNAAEDSQQKYFRIRLDKYQRVDTIECISRQKFPPSALASMYGHHETILNKLIEHLEKNEVKDLYDHFCQPWLAALASDQWLSFRRDNKKLLANYDIGEGIKIADFIQDYINNLDNDELFKVDSNILRHVFENTNLKAAIESKFLNFLKYNKAVLPMFARPDFVEETYKERLASPMYVLLHKNFNL